MLEHIHNLNTEDKNLILHSPMLVSILIAGEDGEIHEDEKHRILELIHTKTFSEKYELKELYKDLDHDAANELRTMIAELPQDRDQRRELIVSKLSRLNHILPKLEHRFQVHLYKSLLQFAHFIAHAEGGFWGVGSLTHGQKELIHLPMIHDPSQQEG